MDASLLGSPVAVLRESALRHNVATMQAWCRSVGVELAPHGKTTMAPSIFRRQLDAGAWAITVADAVQACVAVRSAGAHRVLVANEVVSASGIAMLGGLAAEGVDVLVYADSVEGVARLAASGASLRVLVELGLPGLRAGARTDADADAVAAAVEAAPSLTLAGVAGFEGLVAVEDDGDARVAAFCDRMVASAGRYGAAVVSAGGSTYMDVVAGSLAGHGHLAVLRSGCYVTHDHGVYARTTPRSRGRSGPELVAALEVWTTVLSRPEPTRAILDAGRRHLSYDAGLPVPLPPATGTVVALSDQHAWLELPESSPLAVGDGVRLGISHPCTTFDKWRTLTLVVDDDTPLGHVDTHF